jgi:hypothetical protein
MGQSPDNLDAISGSFDLGNLRDKYRRHDTAPTPRNALAAVEREILEEVASQSGRYGDRLDALLGAMMALLPVIERGMARRPGDVHDASVREAVNTDIAHYNRLRAQAQQVQHYLIIHREAMGFWNHDDVFRCYPIPAPITPLSSTHLPEPLEHP